MVFTNDKRYGLTQGHSFTRVLVITLKWVTIWLVSPSSNGSVMASPWVVVVQPEALSVVNIHGLGLN